MHALVKPGANRQPCTAGLWFRPVTAKRVRSRLLKHIARKMALKGVLVLVSVLACVADGLAARVSHPAEHVIANRPAEHSASQPAAALSLAAAQVRVLLMQGKRSGARLLTAVV